MLTAFTVFKIATVSDSCQFFQKSGVAVYDSDPQVVQGLLMGQILRSPFGEEWKWDVSPLHLSSPSVTAAPCVRSVPPTKQKLPKHRLNSIHSSTL